MRGLEDLKAVEVRWQLCGFALAPVVVADVLLATLSRRYFVVQHEAFGGMGSDELRYRMSRVSGISMTS
jgi:hypothetical protein